MSSLAGCRALVMGGGGLIGSAIARRLIQEGAGDVIAFDNFARGSRSNLSDLEISGRLRIVEGDIRHRETLMDLMQGVDVVFHQAALRVTRCVEVPREAVEVMIGGTLNVLEAATRHRVKKIVFASAASAYGDPLRLPVDEAHPLLDTGLYSACKIAGEKLVQAFSVMQRLPYVILRYFNVYGPGMDLTSPHREVMIRWLDEIEAGRPPVIFGDGSQSMDFVYVDDVVEANMQAAGADISGEAFNVGTGVETTLRSLAERLLQMMASSLTPDHRAARTVNSPSRRYASTTKAREQLGFRSRVPLEEGLRNLLAWRRRQLTAPARTKAA